MTVVEPAASRPAPPTPEECQHPAPVVGVLAHEFSPYRGAMGPEGRRRTTMYYGPVVGGLPIRAWHCEECGLLRLTYLDGRREERRLYPGPQPGLLAVPMAGDVAPEAHLGAQMRVSGLTMPAELAPALLPEPEPFSLPMPTIELPDLGAVAWLTVLLLAATAFELAVISVGAVADWRTASWVGAWGVAAGITFGAAVLLPMISAAFLAAFPWPRLAPSPAEVHAGKRRMDGVTYALVTLLVLLIVGLAVAGLIAIDDWRTPGAMRPLVYGLLAVGGLITALGVGGYAARKTAGRE